MADKLTAEIYSAEGEAMGEVDLNPDIFGIEPNTDVMHQVVTAQLAAKRAGTHSTKTRAEVRGGGAKPWRQKDLVRARHGWIRSPQRGGGGVVPGRPATRRTWDVATGRGSCIWSVTSHCRVSVGRRSLPP